MKYVAKVRIDQMMFHFIQHDRKPGVVYETSHESRLWEVEKVKGEWRPRFNGARTSRSYSPIRDLMSFNLRDQPMPQKPPSDPSQSKPVPDVRRMVQLAEHHYQASLLLKEQSTNGEWGRADPGCSWTPSRWNCS